MPTTINPNKKYSLNEIVDLKLIPSVDSIDSSYGRVYNLVTHFSTDGKKTRILNDATTQRTIKAEHQGTPWGKNYGKILVKGSELIKFLQINKLI